MKPCTLAFLFGIEVSMLTIAVLGTIAITLSFWACADCAGAGCWEWSGLRSARGYGRFGHDSRRAHRIAWELTFGPVPDGLLVCHTCDNPPCIRPEHLFLGTDADNARDMVAKGRGRYGPLAPSRVSA